MYNYKEVGRYRITTKDCQIHERESVMVDLSMASNIFIFYKTADGECKTLFTDTGVDEFCMICNSFNNNPKISNLFKLVGM